MIRDIFVANRDKKSHDSRQTRNVSFSLFGMALIIQISAWSAVCVIEATGTHSSALLLFWQQCFAAVLLSCCYGHRQQLQSSSHIVHKVQGITYLYKKSFVRVQSFTLRIIIRYHTHVHYVNQMRHQALPVVVSNRCSCSGAFIYIYFIYIPVYIHFWSWVLFFFCAEEDFFTLSDTTKTYQIQHIIHIIPFV